MKMFTPKFFPLVYLFLLPCLLYAQLTDSFNDGNFTTNPIWSGNDSGFVVQSNVLRSNGPQASSVIYLSTPSSLMDSAEWNFLIRLDFNPSSTNQVRVYLSSDQPDLTGNLNGYFVQFGETGTAPDSLDVFRQSGGAVTKVFTGVTGMMTSSTSNSVRIKILRHAGGIWDVFADKAGGNNLMAEGSFTDNTYPTSNYFGVVCDYSTASRYNLYYFDDFSVGYITPDVIQPDVASVNVLSSTAIDVRFTEPVELASSENAFNYSVNNSVGNATTATRDAGDVALVHLTFANTFQNATNYTLTVSGVKDLAGNTMNSYLFPFSFYNAQKYDVVINEIMADPDPVVALPLVEYIELHNRTAFPVSIKGWTLSDATSTATLPDVTILPDSFLVLCSVSNTDSFSSSVAKVGVASFPSLTNTGEMLLLKDVFNNLIHAVAYTDGWYGNATKADGGWALEMIDAGNPCTGEGNWKASEDASGGTPGRSNSVAESNPDTIPPQLVRASLQDNNTLLLYFSEAVNSDVAAVASNYVISNSIGNPALALPISFEYKIVRLEFVQSFQAGVIYTVTVSNVADCSDNTVGMYNTARFAIPDSAVAGDVVINEILFNPKTGGYDFVELYNRSTKVIDLKNFDILEMDVSAPDVVLEQSSVTPESYLLFPDEYVVLTESPENIRASYLCENPQAFITMSLPNFPDDEGICVLKIHNGPTIDSLHFSDKWHFALLDEEDGVSLERIDYTLPTQEQSNWHSAASTIGFATPTYLNSQYTQTGISDDAVVIDPEVFTPDSDGEKDFTWITYQFTEPGYTANIRIYDVKGREIRTLARNELLSSNGQFQWDGTDDEGKKARVGIYIAHVEVFNLTGKVKRFKRQLVLAAKFN
jgi:hypothetical protein